MITGTTVELIQISKLILSYKGIVDLLPQAGMCARERSWQVRAGDVEMVV